MVSMSPAPVNRGTLALAIAANITPHDHKVAHVALVLEHPMILEDLVDANELGDPPFARARPGHLAGITQSHPS